jgi:hypothetical protein
MSKGSGLFKAAMTCFTLAMIAAMVAGLYLIQYQPKTAWAGLEDFFLKALIILALSILAGLGGLLGLIAVMRLPRRASGWVSMGLNLGLLAFIWVPILSSYHSSKANFEKRQAMDRAQMVYQQELIAAITSSGDFMSIREKIQASLRKGAKINEIRNSETPLVSAVRMRVNPDVIRLLLDLGADPNLGKPLFTAVQRGDPEITQLLIDRGANVKIRYGRHDRTPLMEALWTPDPNRKIIDLLATAETRMGFPHSAKELDKIIAVRELIAAAKEDDIDTIRRRIRADVDLNSCGYDEKRLTALHWAAQEGHAEACRILLEAGANPKAYRHTPIYLASANGHVKVVNVFLAKRPPTDIETRADALVAAVTFRQPEVCKTVLRSSKDPMEIVQSCKPLVGLLRYNKAQVIDTFEKAGFPLSPNIVQSLSAAERP